MDKREETEFLRDIAFTFRVVASTREGEVWGIPRSGLIMRRNATGFELEGVMPFAEIEGAAELGRDVPATADELLSYQRADFAYIRARFITCGFTFTDPEGLLS